ncbi:MAG: FHA domain-containing protein [Anaerolineae bacterium]|nr:FHA domain-containing protein [Anaerolineae bacterium]
MPAKSLDTIKKVTRELSDEMLLQQLHGSDSTTYRPVPHIDGQPRTTWRIRLELGYDSSRCIALDINDEVVLGRSGDGPDFIALFDDASADHLGVSRRHALLRPTDNKLYILDLNSTNGTRLNGHSIGVNIPYSLSDSDLVTLGKLDLVVKIVEKPRSDPHLLEENDDQAEVLMRVAYAITSQLDRPGVLKQALELTLGLTEASEASIWLVDEQTGELFLECGMGIDDDQIKRLPMTDTLPGRVITTGKPLRANRELDGQRIKVKTGYLVEAVIYVPLTLGGVTFGVLSAVHHESGRLFSQQEEKRMSAIAEFTAVAVQNARLYQTTERALARRTKVITAFNYALSYDLKTRLNTIIGYAGLMAGDPTLDEATVDSAQQIVVAGNQMARLVERLLEITALNEDISARLQPFDLVDVVTRAVHDSEKKAIAKSTNLDLQLVGEPYILQGDAGRLHHSILNLIDNAIKYSPPGAEVHVALVYWENEVMISVRDTGPGIPTEDLPYLFERYFRSQPSGDGEVSIGLGLEFVRATAEAHRGSVLARNADGGGAEFIIKLPSTLRVV